MSHIAAAHRRFGTCGLLPTLITATASVVDAALRAASEKPIPGVLGLHLEGPHLDRQRKGVHDQRAMRPMSEADVDLLLAARVGRLLLTVAPEQVSADQVRHLVAGGVTVSLGHTNAPFSKAMELIDAGARGITHLFNAMSPLENRAPGVVGAALDAGTVWCGVIADGFHVDAATLRIALRAKRPPGRLFLVTDAMPTVGSTATSFSLGRSVASLRQGRLTATDDDGREVLAGSHLDMASAVRFCVAKLELSIDEALRMASLYPAMFLRLDRDRGRIRPGFAADLVHLDAGLNVSRTWVAGVSSRP
jgi:N-acetylglucosamine-6-phosphate deacetylase